MSKTFGRDPKAEKRIEREDAFLLRQDRSPFLRKNATIVESISCTYAKTGMHDISVTIKNGHIQAFSCECLDMVAEEDLKLEKVITEGKTDTCYDVYLRLQHYVKNYQPHHRWTSEATLLEDAERLPVLAPVVAAVRHMAYRQISIDRKDRQLAAINETVDAGDYEQGKLARRSKLLRNLVNNYFHPRIAKMFSVAVSYYLDGPPTITIRFNGSELMEFDEELRPINPKPDAWATVEDFVNAKVNFGRSISLPNGIQCPFCTVGNRGQYYSRINAHLNREPHRYRQSQVLHRFFSRFVTDRQDNFKELKERKLYNREVSVGFTKLSSTVKRMQLQKELENERNDSDEPSNYLRSA